LILGVLDNVLAQIAAEEDRVKELDEMTKAAKGLFSKFKEGPTPKYVEISKNNFQATSMYRYSENCFIVEFPGNKVGLFSAEGLTKLREHNFEKSSYMTGALQIESDD
jgi:hypothetical protein